MDNTQRELLKTIVKMFKWKTLIKVLLLLMFLMGKETAQDKYADFHSAVLKYYNYTPSKLNSEENVNKEKELSRFWHIIKSDKSFFLPLMRHELADTTNPPFFFFDGGRLLSTISNENADIELIINALPLVDIREVNSFYYLNDLCRYASQGYNVTKAAFHILDYPSFYAEVNFSSLPPTTSINIEAFLTYKREPLQLRQNDAFFYALLPMKEELYLDTLIKLAYTEKNDTSLNSILTALWMITTLETDSVISDIKTRTHSEIVKKHINELEEKSEECKPGFISFASSNIKGLKEKRRTMANNAGQYSYDEVLSLSDKIRTAYYKLMNKK